jgi:rare lipoprotein A
MSSQKIDLPSGVICPVRRLGSKRRANAVRLAVAVAAGVALSACAQSAMVGDRATSRSVAQQSSTTRVAAVMRQESRRARSRQQARTQPARTRQARTQQAKTQHASSGVASYYWQGTRTASGERFNPKELTAAHPSLPFGTKVRVTNVSTGKSVTVRVNDRGPFVRGRVIDVSHSAAQSLGMVGQGVAKVKLDVVE